MPLDTDLHKSAHKGDIQGVKHLVLSGEIDVHAKGAQDRTALHRAAGANHVGIIRFLLQAGADVDCADRCRRTPLHWAAISGNLDATQLLLESGGDLRLKTSSGMTPLMCAVQQRWHAVAETILDWSAAYAEGGDEDVPSPDELCAMPDAEGKTVAVVAKEAGDVPMQKLLKTHAPKEPASSCCCAGGSGRRQQLAAVGPRLSAGANGQNTANLSVSEPGGGLRRGRAADGGEPGAKEGVYDPADRKGGRSRWLCFWMSLAACCGEPPSREAAESLSPATAETDAPPSSAELVRADGGKSDSPRLEHISGRDGVNGKESGARVCSSQPEAGDGDIFFPAPLDEHAAQTQAHGMTAAGPEGLGHSNGTSADVSRSARRKREEGRGDAPVDAAEERRLRKPRSSARHKGVPDRSRKPTKGSVRQEGDSLSSSDVRLQAAQDGLAGRPPTSSEPGAYPRA